MAQPDAATDADRTVGVRPTASARWTFIRTESGSAAFLVAAAVAALVWANVAPGTYTDFWHTHLTFALGDHALSLDLREWVNSGLMTVFFLVIGLEVRREFDMGELRELNRVTLPFMAGLAGMVVPVLIFLAFNAGDSAASGWGVAMSTDTAFALGMLALLGKRFPRRLYTFVLTIAVVDDFVVLAVIALVYSGNVHWPPLLVGAVFFAAIIGLRSAGSRRGPVYAALAVAMWLAFEESGVDPVVVGLLIGLMTFAYPAPRSELERATGLFRSFREQPTPELEREARMGIASAISPNERLLRMYHPWSSYLVVPLFALANTGIELNGSVLSSAVTSPLTLGVFLAFVVGKPLGVVGATALTTWWSKGRLRPPVGWASVAGGGAITGIGFTIAVLIATMAFSGKELEEAKIGILAAVLGSVLVTALVALVATRLPKQRRIRALLGTAPVIVDLAVPVDADRDHIRGPREAPVTVVEYGDFECPYCGRAEPVVRDLLADFGDIRYVWRHLPLTDVHPRAQLAAEAAEAAAEQGAFWPMHDRLLDHQDRLTPLDLVAHATELGLDADRFSEAMRARDGAARVDEDTESADLSGVAGTPTFFVNGRRHRGAYDIAGLSAAVRAARARAMLDEEDAEDEE
ncbi:sodium:proton antiporter [Streptomyces sp. CNQ-509]|uniref:Na+/H+ antiporter NhaA n=1 Tax=Streptomyces sp. CNQ-509 TaxID=444103 RepID=UPI00062E0861|nr:Na+/H+ antiporter NhaA [Streptomyces sp. CNQ-509]AKH85972.1 sodium:proton antiporter [Streptomyces sp. CNQ-509]